MTFQQREHPEWTDRFSDYLDEELTDRERQEIDQHLRDCPPCAQAMAELRQVVERATALRLASSHDAGPGEHVWQALAAQLPPQSSRSEPGRARRFSFTIPQLAAASVVLALLSGWGAVRLINPVQVARDREVAATADAPAAEAIAVDISDPQYDAAVGDLERALQLGRGRLDPATVATVEDDLRIIDQALEEARQALMADPANGYLSGHIVETRQRKLDLLRRAAALTTDSQL